MIYEDIDFLEGVKEYVRKNPHILSDTIFLLKQEVSEKLYDQRILMYKLESHLMLIMSENKIKNFDYLKNCIMAIKDKLLMNWDLFLTKLGSKDGK